MEMSALVYGQEDRVSHIHSILLHNFLDYGLPPCLAQ